MSGVSTTCQWRPGAAAKHVEGYKGSNLAVKCRSHGAWSTIL